MSCLYCLLASISHIRSQLLLHNGGESSRHQERQQLLNSTASDMFRTARFSSLRRRSGGDPSRGSANVVQGNTDSSGQSGSQGSSSSSARPKPAGSTTTNNSTVIAAVVAVVMIVGTVLFALWFRRMLRRSRRRNLLRQARLASLDSKPQMWDINLDSAALRSLENLRWKNMTPIAVDFSRDTPQFEPVYSSSSSTPTKLHRDSRPLHERAVGRLLSGSHGVAKGEDICVRIAVAIAMPSCRGRKSGHGSDEEPSEVCLGFAEARWSVPASQGESH
ncbi:hypothetical protein CERSUDRAFT_116353 [Gelatoporia subvermispora B]|uniref:Uncharacterized protein n=1 Tax=Ceriporiopsis subvermispora (strain B) TaxID=914234 RepID=M2PHR5_CERS8|nr:hypothetical protein CERSUDRAFT_116353 [Gelatoporia subvermispora B]